MYYYKTGLIFLNSILEMTGTLSVKSLLVVGFHTHTQTHTYTQLMQVYWSLHQIINNGESL